MTINMKMPKTCSQCRFEGMYNRRLHGYECFALLDYVDAENHCLKRDDECPLIDQKNVERICRNCDYFTEYADGSLGVCSKLDRGCDIKAIPLYAKACDEWKKREE